jgi:hypothetical protein
MVRLGFRDLFLIFLWQSWLGEYLDAVSVPPYRVRLLGYLLEMAGGCAWAVRCGVRMTG